jgi:mRNA interferase RelE/StbE
LGKAFDGDKAGLWRYRIGDYRLIRGVQDEKITLLGSELASPRMRTDKLDYR